MMVMAAVVDGDGREGTAVAMVAVVAGHAAVMLSVTIMTTVV